jgi:SHS2 domain-containing protein
MTKRDIIKFLERKQQEKRDAVTNAFDANREQLVQSIYSAWGLPALADKMQPLLVEAFRLWDDWKKEHKDYEGLQLNHYFYSLINQLISYTESKGATYKQLIADHIRLDTKAMQIQRQEYHEQLNDVGSTFNTVIATVQQMKIAKQAAVYLKELGFDLSELENPAEPVQTALMIPVNTRFLFVDAA